MSRPRQRLTCLNAVRDAEHGCDACSHRGERDNALKFITDGHGVHLLCEACRVTPTMSETDRMKAGSTRKPVGVPTLKLWAAPAAARPSATPGVGQNLRRHSVGPVVIRCCALGAVVIGPLVRLKCSWSQLARPSRRYQVPFRQVVWPIAFAQVRETLPFALRVIV